MKRLIGIALLVVLIGNLALIIPPRVHGERMVNDTILSPEAKYQKEAQIVYSVLTNIHYEKKEIPVNDSLSGAIYDRYMQRIDPGKFYFVQADIDDFAKYRLTLDESIPEGDLAFAYHVFNRYRELAIDRLDWVLTRLEGEPFNFTLDESYQVDREDTPYATSQEELDDVWRKLIKNQALSYRLGDEEKTWEDISEALVKRYERQRRSYEQFKSEDVFQIFMNTFAEAFDPHTNYFSPVSSENFQINMSQSLEGIGARLQSDLDYTKVADIV
ncbi:MAG TPA: tail-specific protease, partial [Cytophagales bacterium]|nr:tail-specific protease [Cytophagales bacterium]